MTDGKTLTPSLRCHLPKFSMYVALHQKQMNRVSTKFLKEMST